MEPQAAKPGGRFASTVEVQTYCGGRLHERPRRFTWEEAWLEVEDILREWRSPEESWFLVQAGDGRCFLLAYSWTAHSWRAAWVAVRGKGSNSRAGCLPGPRSNLKYLRKIAGMTQGVEKILLLWERLRDTIGLLIKS
jgi:hypothetical protein